MTVLKDLAVETIFALFLDHFLIIVFLLLLFFFYGIFLFFIHHVKETIFNLHWKSCSHFYKSCKMTGSLLPSWPGWRILSHQHTYHMGCWWCHKPNESDSCGLNGGNMLCSMCFLWSAFVSSYSYQYFFAPPPSLFGNLAIHLIFSGSVSDVLHAENCFCRATYQTRLQSHTMCCI
jgi:hypothetical protein